MAAVLLGGCKAPPPPVVLRVTTGVDAHDGTPGDGVCEVTAGAGDCSLRAAVDEANATPADVSVRVVVPEGWYRLTLPGADDTNAGGDLDLTGDHVVVLEARGRGAAIDAGGSDHVLQVLAGTTQVHGFGISGARDAGASAGPGVLDLEASSVHDNAGGGLEVAAGATALSLESTISGNGGVAVSNGGRYVGVSTTIVGNVTGTGALYLRSSIVSAPGPACEVPATSAGHNLSSDATCGLTRPTDLPDTDAKLQGLGVGAVPAAAPRTGSPAVDAVPPDTQGCIGGRDQFGTARPSGSSCDIGAVELTTGSSFVVDDATDAPDADPGDARCRTAAGTCTVRAAIDESNVHAGQDSISLEVDPVLSRSGADEDRNATGDLDVADSVSIDGRGAVIDGGRLDRVLEVGGFDVRLDHLTVTGGQVDGEGGGIRVTGGDLTLSESTVRANTAVGDGGGIAFRGEALRVEGSTLEGNTAQPASSGPVTYGGAIYIPNGTGIVERSTLSANRASIGGGIETGTPDADYGSSEVTVRGTTVADNTGVALVRTSVTSCDVGGCQTEESGAIHVQASALVNRFGDCSGVDSGGYNVAAGTDCPLADPTDRTGTNPLLGPLAENGGPTRTRLPYANAPLVDAIPVADDGSCSTTTERDQRGVTRPQGPACDIGAVEGSATSAASPLTLLVDTAVDEGDAEPGDGSCATSTGACTLRAAVDESNAYPTIDSIVIAEGTDPSLGLAGADEDADVTGDVDITAAMALVGNGNTIDGAGLDRVLDVATLDGDVTISNLTVTGGRTDEAGGGVRHSGPSALVLDHVTVEANSASSGGGVSGGLVRADGAVIRSNTATGGGGGVSAGTLIAIDTTLWANAAGGPGGGVSASVVRATGSVIGSNTATGDGGGVAAGTLEAADTTLSANTAAGYGGAASAQTVALLRTSIRSNRASSGGGLSIGRSGATGPSTVDTSEIVDNRTTGTAFALDAGWGGGIITWSDVTVRRTTISDNEATSAPLASGGGIATHGTLTVDASTIARNQARNGGGIDIDLAKATTIIDSTLSANAAVAGRAGAVGDTLGLPHGATTIVASTLQGNTASGLGWTIATSGPLTLQGSIISSAGPDCFGGITSLGHNVGSDRTCVLTATGDRPDTDPRLLPLSVTGGPTATHLLAADSPALDAAPVGTAGLCDGTLATDQRGVARPQGAGCDVGAVEGSGGPIVPLDLVVDDAADARDAAPGDGRCATAAGRCTLRAAIDETNASSGPDHLTIAAGVDPVLTRAGRDEDQNATGDLDVLEPLSITGNGATIDAAGLDRVVQARYATLALSGLTLTHGDTTRSSDFWQGGAVWTLGGDLTLDGVTVEDSATVWANVQADYGRLRITRSTVRNNIGAGISVDQTTATLTIDQSTVSGNSGFGILQGGSATDDLSVVNSTITDNLGGGIEWATAAEVRASTISANGVGLAGPGYGSPSFTLQGVILDNTDDCADAVVTSLGYDIGDDADCALTQPSDSSAPPQLGPLADHGGPTLTQLPATGSPAIDAVPIGTAGLCDGTIPTDQRGTTRPAGAACDTGATES